MTTQDKCRLIIQLGQQKKLEDLRVIVENIESEDLILMAKQKLEQGDINLFYNFVLQGFDESPEAKSKMQNLILAMFRSLGKIELNTKETVALITRTMVDLDTFNTNYLVELVEVCQDALKDEESKSVFWKDLLPQLVLLLCSIPKLKVNGIEMSGQEYRSVIVKNICLMKWHVPILTPLASMFKELLITKDERQIVINKLSEQVFFIQATELPAFAFQLFSICNSPSLLMVPILFLQKYFNKYYYTKLYSTLDSNTTDYDSIEINSNSELQAIQETVFYHLSNSTEFKLNEKDVVMVFRNLLGTPHYLLTPFMISALLSLTKINRHPDVVRLSTSAVLPFLRTVIKNNEIEKEMSKQSFWCRQTFDRNTVNLERIVDVLIDQSVTGNEIVTPGLIALAFTLLKTKNQPDLNQLGIQFLHQFLKKRHIFGHGIMKQLSELLFAYQESPQYAECLNTLSLTNTLTISECIESVKTILDFFLLIPGHHSMRMISFVYPLIKMSFSIQDSLIEVLTKAMNHSDVEMRKLGIYGFCMLLKNLKNNNSRRPTNITGANLSFTQGTISGYSLMSQSAFGTQNNVQKHFDMLTLEIVGILRKCFNETHESKVMLYEGLTRAIEFNPKLTTHILTFMDWHFRSYFDDDSTEIKINFDRCVLEVNGRLEVWDNLGKLIMFISTCIVICDQNSIAHDNEQLIKLLENLLDKVETITLSQAGITDVADQKSKEMGIQLVNFLEGIMAYAVIAAKSSNNLMEKFYKAFQHHQKLIKEIKSVFVDKKTSGKKVKSKPVTSTQTSILGDAAPTQFTISGSINITAEAAIQFKPVNIWEINILQKLLCAIFNESVPFTTNSQLESLKKDQDFRLYLLRVTTEMIESFRHLPDYRHVKHSRRMFLFLCETTKIIYEKCIKGLVSIMGSFDTATAQICLDCFKQCLLTADVIYKRKLSEFMFVVAGKDPQSIPKNAIQIIRALHDLLQQSLEENSIIENDSDSKKIQKNLMHSLEILYNFLPAEEDESAIVYEWLHKFCLENSIENKHLDLIHKLLFTQRIKSNDCQYFDVVALQLSKEFGMIQDEEEEPTFKLKSIAADTRESAFLYLCGAMRKELEDVQYTVNKVKSIHAKIKFLGEKGVDDDHIQSLKKMERAICAHLIHISSALVHLTNCRIPLGTCSDNLIRLLIDFYTNTTNVTKHLILRHATLNVVYQQIRFDKLAKSAGKPLASKIYELITYVDNNILQNSEENDAENEEVPKKKGKSDPKSDKMKVLKDTKYLPKLILWVENFNKFVIMLDRKTKSDVSHYLHQGTVRDFRIKTANLAEAIKNRGSVDAGDPELDEVNEEDLDKTPEIEQDEEDGGNSGTAVEKIQKNMAKIKRKTRSNEPNPTTAKKRRRQINIPDEIAQVLNPPPLNLNGGAKSPEKKKARKSKK